MAATVDRDLVSGNLQTWEGACTPKNNWPVALMYKQLTFCSHTPDNKGVNYQVFLRALHKFAKVEMRLGR
jgi:hypothetical protein